MENKQHAQKIMSMVCETPFPAQSDIDLVEEYLDIMFTEKDKGISKLKEKFESKVNELVDTYTDNCRKDKRIRELEEELIKQKTFKMNLQKMVEERDDLLIKHGIKKPAIRIDLSRND